jgi:Family of unknown function (DUF6176)
MEAGCPYKGTERRRVMDQVCFALPVLAGKTEEARAFFSELETQRKSAYAASEQRINITKESWYLQQTPQGDLLLAYIESPDFANALRMFSQSQDEFDQWFKQQVAEVTGVDLNDPPPGPLSEQLSSYEA